MKRKYIIISFILLIGGFLALNSYIYHAKQEIDIQESNISFEEIVFPEEVESEEQPSFDHSLSLKYIELVEWPPQIHSFDESYSCIPGGNEFEQEGITEEKIIERHSYCVTKVTEGSLGNYYTRYSYASAQEAQGVNILTFSLRFSQCANYNEPQQRECEQEQTDFDPDTLYLQTNWRE